VAATLKGAYHHQRSSSSSHRRRPPFAISVTPISSSGGTIGIFYAERWDRATSSFACVAHTSTHFLTSAQACRRVRFYFQTRFDSQIFKSRGVFFSAESLRESQIPLRELLRASGAGFVAYFFVFFPLCVDSVYALQHATLRSPSRFPETSSPLFFLAITSTFSSMVASRCRPVRGVLRHGYCRVFGVN
jgi:hypothetical protein